MCKCNFEISNLIYVCIEDLNLETKRTVCGSWERVIKEATSLSLRSRSWRSISSPSTNNCIVLCKHAVCSLHRGIGCSCGSSIGFGADAPSVVPIRLCVYGNQHELHQYQSWSSALFLQRWYRDFFVVLCSVWLVWESSNCMSVCFCCNCEILRGVVVEQLHGLRGLHKSRVSIL